MRLPYIVLLAGPSEDFQIRASFCKPLEYPHAALVSPGRAALRMARSPASEMEAEVQEAFKLPPCSWSALAAV